IAQKVAPTSTSVLITGNSGTGKEVFAKAIHKASERTGSFVAINCSAIPVNLFESELFGYVEGAFTGAIKKGKI
ncbi:MAG TPA: sigma-54-dependent Fis family transcriptional regulator, partial [Clostridium sp.]|nr:sigma-54-dependent Fis family transcriptional regulator [Clostridium sp.]